MSRTRFAFLLLLGGALVALVLHFLSFARAVHAAAPPEPAPQADGIVALTGGSLQRLKAGVRLLEQGRGQRLLISGVNPAATDAEIAAAVGLTPATLDCCVDLGRQASDTIGNAAETAAWARAHGYRHLILVTEDYHMPRSLIELQISMPEVLLTPYPVSSRLAEPAVWQADPRQAGRLATEYFKLLTIQVREAVFSGGRRPAEPPVSAKPPAAPTEP